MAPSNPYTPTYLPTATATAPNLSSVTFLLFKFTSGAEGEESEAKMKSADDCTCDR